MCSASGSIPWASNGRSGMLQLWAVGAASPGLAMAAVACRSCGRWVHRKESSEQGQVREKEDGAGEVFTDKWGRMVTNLRAG